MIVLRGAGRAFCAGYDLTEDAEEGELDAAQLARRSWRRRPRRMLEFTDCPKPTIAQVHSYCLAGGTDLMLACDLAVAADDAKFGYVDVRFGSGVVSMFLPWVVGVREAKELLFTGEDRDPGRRGAADRPGEPGGARRRAGRRHAGARRTRSRRTSRSSSRRRSAR